MDLVIPMSGTGSRFRQAGFPMPKPLVPIDGIPMIERLLSCFPIDWRTTFVLAEAHRATDLPAVLRRLRPNGNLIFIDDHRLGPAHALRIAINSLRDADSVFVSYCDYGMIWSADDFTQFVASSNCDACVVSYSGFHPHFMRSKKFAYSHVIDGRVVGVREKSSFTNCPENEYASSGGYYFRRVDLLREALQYQFDNKLFIDDEAYVSLTVEAMLRRPGPTDVRVFPISYFLQWGTPDDISDFEYWIKTFRANDQWPDSKGHVDQILIPMAGRGTRLSQQLVPKPYTPIQGMPMFCRALTSLPSASNIVLVALKKHSELLLPSISSETKVIFLAESPNGQALSVMYGLDSLGSGDVIVSASDHAVAIDPLVFEQFRLMPDADAAVFVVRGYTGAFRSPTDYSFVAHHLGGSEKFPRLTKVSVKRPLTNHPQSEAMLIGTFWFRNAEVLRLAIDLLLEHQVTTATGEYSLDSVFDLMQKSGMTVRTIEVSGYINWGDSQSLQEANYWREVFSNAKV